MKKFAFALIALTAFALLFAGCPGAEAAVEATATFTIVNGDEPVSIDPAKITGVPEHRIYMALFEGLVINDPKTCRALPGVAESWEYNADFTKITYKLRDNAVWSDGTKITAQTVVDSWLRELNPETAGEYAYMITDFVKGAAEYNADEGKPEDVAIKAVDERTFTVELNGPTPFFAEVTAHYAYAIVPMHVIAKHGDAWINQENFVGNGPFTLKEWLPKERLVVEKNPKYWDAKNIALKSITFLPINDNSAAYQMFKEETVDWITAIPVDMMDEIKLSPNYRPAAEYATYYFNYNVTRAPFDDVRVRKALAMAIDKKAIAEKVTKGGEVPTDAMVPSSTGYTATKGNGYDIAAAKALLAEAGYPDGKGFPEVTVLYNTSERHKAVCEFIQQQWKDNLGISVNLINKEWQLFLQDRQKTHDFQVARAGWIADYLDPSTFLYMYKSTSGNNDGLYKNPEFDRLLELAATQSGDARMKTLMDAEKIMIDMDQAAIPIYHYSTQDMVRLDLWDGWYNNPMNVHNWKFIKPKAAK
jgi:oligopeptide transport system substrate-binding protein